MTSKGELIRAILFPKPIHFRFYNDLLKVTLLFLVIGLGGMIYTVYTWIRNGVGKIKHLNRGIIHIFYYFFFLGKH